MKSSARPVRAVEKNGQCEPVCNLSTCGRPSLPFTAKELEAISVLPFQGDQAPDACFVCASTPALAALYMYCTSRPPGALAARAVVFRPAAPVMYSRQRLKFVTERRLATVGTEKILAIGRRTRVHEAAVHCQRHGVCTNIKARIAPGVTGQHSTKGRIVG